MIDFKNMSVVVLGLGSSGVASAKFLKEKKANVFVSDNNGNEKQQEYGRELNKLSIEFELGTHTRERIENADCIIISPGVPLESEPVLWAKNKNIKLIGEIELGFQFCPATIVATTGTNGKTTVTTLIGKMLEKAGKKVYLAGNIGTPFCSIVSNLKKDDFVSLEVSSFQLETIVDFKPKVSVILNLTPDHLDRYNNLDEYYDAKKRIYLNQERGDFVVLNYRDDKLKVLGKDILAKVVFFGDGKSNFNEENFNLNQLAVMKVAEVLGVSLDVCKEVFSEFKGIEHRMEFVRNINGVEFINDSKGTTPESTIWGLESYSKPVILLAGGSDKHVDFDIVAPYAKGKVKSLILFGQTKPLIKKALGNIVDTFEANSIEEAVSIAYSQAEEGDCVLLSPMCASFDMFNNYEHRGRVFKEIVNKLDPSNKSFISK